MAPPTRPGATTGPRPKAAAPGVRRRLGAATRNIVGHSPTASTSTSVATWKCTLATSFGFGAGPLRAGDALVIPYHQVPRSTMASTGRSRPDIADLRRRAHRPRAAGHGHHPDAAQPARAGQGAGEPRPAVRRAAIVGSGSAMLEPELARLGAPRGPSRGARHGPPPSRQALDAVVPVAGVRGRQSGVNADRRADRRREAQVPGRRLQRLVNPGGATAPCCWSGSYADAGRLDLWVRGCAHGHGGGPRPLAQRPRGGAGRGRRFPRLPRPGAVSRVPRSCLETLEVLTGWAAQRP